MVRLLLFTLLACDPIPVEPAADTGWLSPVARRPAHRDLTPERERTPTARGDDIEAPCALGETRWVRVPCASWGEETTIETENGLQCKRCLVNVCESRLDPEDAAWKIELPDCDDLRHRQRARLMRGE